MTDDKAREARYAEALTRHRVEVAQSAEYSFGWQCLTCKAEGWAWSSLEAAEQASLTHHAANVVAVADAEVEAATRELRAEMERLDGAISAVLALAFDARRSAGGSFTAKVDVLSIERALTGTALAQVGAADTQPEGATCLCGEVLRPGFGWHSCNAGRSVAPGPLTVRSSDCPCGAPLVPEEIDGVVRPICRACSDATSGSNADTAPEATSWDDRINDELRRTGKATETIRAMPLMWAVPQRVTSALASNEADEASDEPDGCRLNGCHPAPVSSGEAGTGEALDVATLREAAHIVSSVRPVVDTAPLRCADEHLVRAMERLRERADRLEQKP